MAEIVFRVDASLQIGNGHVMRCLTLADALKIKGHDSHFISREHPGNLNQYIRSRGHQLIALPAGNEEKKGDSQIHQMMSSYSEWLGVGWRDDAVATNRVLTALKPEWLIVDHYAVDEVWEEAVKPDCHRLMVIDDLANRPHVCDLLLDQNLDRQTADYKRLVPDSCVKLTGTRYALLKPEFAAMREYSLKRRDKNPVLCTLLISMGGTNVAGVTELVLTALQQADLPKDISITVVMGPNAMGTDRVRNLAEDLPWKCEVRVGASDMAQIMAESDLAIGAAGSTSWERCCLGLPSIIIALAENQVLSCRALVNAGAAKMIDSIDSIRDRLAPMVAGYSTDKNALKIGSRAAAVVVSGDGVRLVIDAMNRIQGL